MIYISLLRNKTEVADSVVQLEDRTTLSQQCPVEFDECSAAPVQPPTIVFTAAGQSPTSSDREEEEEEGEEEEAEVSTHSFKSVPSPAKGSPEGTDPETSDWNSGSSGSPLSSTHEKQPGRISEPSSETDRILMETISQHVEDTMSGNEPSTRSHASRIPVRMASEGESQRSTSSPGRLEGDGRGGIVRKISVKVKRPRSPNSIMAEARLRQEQEKEKRKREKEDRDRAAAAAVETSIDKEEPVLTGSASEGGEMSESGITARPVREEVDPLKSDEDDREKMPCVSPIPSKQSPESPRSPSQYNGFAEQSSVPVTVMPAQSHDMALLLEALRHARTEANYHDQKINSPTEQPDYKQVIDANIEKLEAQLEAVKEQSRELFHNPDKDREMSEPIERGRPVKRESQPGRQGVCKSPPRGILDVMANQGADGEETALKERVSHPVPQPSAASPERPNPPGILRYRRSRSPTDHSRSYSSPEVQTGEDSGSPARRQTDQSEELDPDKRLIRFLTNEIENLKLKMKVMEKRTRSPGAASPYMPREQTDRDRSPSAISSRARARFSELGPDRERSSYSPLRRSNSPGMVESRSKSPAFSLDSRGESPYRSDHSRSQSRSPSRSPLTTYGSRTPETRRSREATRPVSPSARVLSLQDLSTAIQDDADGQVNFSPASGGKRINLGYTSPIRKVNSEIWGNDVSEEDYYKDTAKYEKWKRLIARDAVSDEDMLELKQALASCLVELDILQAKLNNANTDIREKMAKTTDVLNDCRAHLTKSQAENAELRSQNEREKARADALELRMKEMEENLHSAKSNQDDLTQELEESVHTLKGIVGLDKNTMSQLEQENDKLRERVSTLQRENIKLKEDFNELKMYNDKAQTTIRDLKDVLEDNRTERKQLVAEIRKLQSQGQNTKISSIVNHYMEKGLYEEPEKEPPPVERSRSPSPQPRRFDKFSRARSASPVQTRAKFESSQYRPTTPVLPTVSTKPSTTSYSFGGTLGSSRSQTPTPFTSYNYEDISPAVTSANHQIYPHRRTRSYVQRFGQNDLDESYTNMDLEDPELKELLQPQKISYDLDLSDSYKEAKKADTFEDDAALKSTKRQLQYSTYLDSGPTKPAATVAAQTKPAPKVESRPKSPYRYPNQVLNRKSEFEEEIENRKFILALDTAVKESPAQAVKRQLQSKFENETTEAITNGFGGDTDAVTREPSGGRWRSPGRGILKSNKSVQNLSIKEGMSPKRSYESRSYSPSSRIVSRSQRPVSPSPAPTRSYSAAVGATSKSSAPVNTERLYSSSSMGHIGASPSPATRSFSPSTGSGGYSPAGKRYGRMDMGTRDSGYSTPNSQQGGRSYSTGRTGRDPTCSSSPKPLGRTVYTGRKSPVMSLLTEEERRYADLLIDKYTS